MTAILPVILAGGAGTRLWPVSRETMPKHLAKLIGEDSLLQLTARRRTLLQEAARRAWTEAAPEGLITVAARHQDLLIRRQLEAVDPALATHRLLEPVGRNTAAAIALAALYARKHFGRGSILWVCPSDHLIRDQAALSTALKHALPVASSGELLTFGIEPTRPDTGYGYIKARTPISEDEAYQAVLKVERFVEKPDLPTAEAMLAEGGYLWNSGMFLFRADRIIEELAEHEPAILEATRAAFDAAEAADDGSLCPPLDLYENIPSMPIDKAVMERARRIAVVPCDPDWTDLGSWHAIWEISAKDDDGNATRGDVLLHDAKNCLVHSSGRLVACAGVQDLAVIETEDAVLVVDRNRSEPVKELVGGLNAAARSETAGTTAASISHGAAPCPWMPAFGDWRSCRARRHRQPSMQARMTMPCTVLVMAGSAGLELERGGERLTPRGGRKRRSCTCHFGLSASANAGDDDTHASFEISWHRRP